MLSSPASLPQSLHPPASFPPVITSARMNASPRMPRSAMTAPARCAIVYPSSAMTHTIRLPGVMGAYGMMGRMIVETPNDNVETLSNQELTGRLDHLDTMLHEIDRKLTAVTAHLDTALGFIDEHKP